MSWSNVPVIRDSLISVSVTIKKNPFECTLELTHWEVFTRVHLEEIRKSSAS